MASFALADSNAPTSAGATRVDTLVSWVAGTCLLGAGVIHAAFVVPHWHEHPSHGAFFAAVTIVQVILGVLLIRSGSRRWLGISALCSLGVIAVWFVSRTVGIGGEVEAVGLADGVTTALEGLVIVGLLVGSRTALAGQRLRAVPAGATMGATAVAVLALTVPSVVLGPSHQDHHHDHAPSGSQASINDHGSGSASHDAASPAHDAAAHGAASAVPVGSAAAPAAHHHAKVPCPNPTPAEQQAADKLIQDTKQATARLANVETAKAEGYMRFGDGDIAGTWHYINWKYQADSAVLDPAHPESIIYWQLTPESPLFLIGVMFVTPRAGSAGAQIGGCLTQWHSHGAPFAPEGVPTPEMLHVWFVPLPGGPFVTDPGHPDE